MVITFAGAGKLMAGVDYDLMNRSGQITTFYFSSSKNAHDITEILGTDLAEQFRPLTKSIELSKRKTYWLKLDLSDADLSESDEWIVRFLIYDEITLYYQFEDTLHSKISGKMHRQPDEGSHHFIYFPIETNNLIDGRFLYARINHVYRIFPLAPPHYWHPYLYTLRSHYFTKSEIADYANYLMFIGGMMLMVFYSLGIYFMNRDRLFIFYTIYLFSLVLYLGLRLPVIFGPLEMKFPLIMGIYNEVVQVIVNITYLVFAVSFLNARHDFPKLYSAIRYAVMLLLAVIFFQLMFSLSGKYAYLQSHLLQFQRYFMVVFSIAAYIHILKNYKSRIVFFLITGSLFFLFGSAAAMLFGNIRYMMFGTALEVFVFSLGTGYRIKLSEKEKQSIENEMNKVRLTALRAQMNPHFIFNSLNAIRAYVISTDTRKASDYLSKFSYLIRLILQYSSKDSISLREEIDSLSLYVELEQLRFRENLNFTLITPPGLKAEQYRVPPLILQPYVENAIIHGLAPKKGEKKLEINIEAGKTHLWISIRDNGVGRSLSRKKPEYHGLKHESMAMELTSKRIDLSARQKTEENNILITDLKENGGPAGTEVCIKLPVQKNIILKRNGYETQSGHY